MTDRDQLDFIKTVAKRLGRATETELHNAQNEVANICDHAHWNALMTAWKRNWRPTTEQINKLSDILSSCSHILFMGETIDTYISSQRTPSDQRMIDGHAVVVDSGFMDVVINGDGWAVVVGHAPSKPPIIDVDRRNGRPSVLDDETFKAKILDLAKVEAEKLCQRIAVDWPEKSTNPDADGHAVHPLNRTRSAEWHCLHCDEKFTGAEMAANMWHCPKCSASPIDIFETPFWNGAK